MTQQVSRSGLEVRRDNPAPDFRVETFTPAHLPLVAEFSKKYWSRPQTASFYRWRYVDSQPYSKMILALTDEECLGMVFGLRKTYVIAGQRTSCLEVFDWHRLPGLKGVGVGSRVMRAMMDGDERLLLIGGTASAHSALDALGWQKIGWARAFELPMSGEFLVAGLRARLTTRIPGDRLLLDAIVGSWFKPRRRAVQGEVVPISNLDGEVQSLYYGETGYDFLQVPDASLMRWVTGATPGNGTYGLLRFNVGSSLLGWAMTRVYGTKDGREASILDVFAAAPTVASYTWIVSEAASLLARARPRVIRARASCPMLQEALCANRFRQRADAPVYTWSSRTMPQHLRLHVTLNHSDEPLRPYLSPQTGLVI